MKIAVVWKGGNGKTSVSWLLTQYSKTQTTCYAIDSDHNMDLSFLLWLEYNDETETFHKNHDEFRKCVWLDEDKQRHRIILKHDKPLFSIEKNKEDDYTKKVRIGLWSQLYAMITGLWDWELFQADRCSHGHSAPLKYYLALLQDWDNDIIIDSVAWSDMFNFGLYNTVDHVLIVVNDQYTSEKVAIQLIELAERLQIPHSIILNNITDEEAHKKYTKKRENKILWIIPNDPALKKYIFEDLHTQTQESIENIYNKLKQKPKQNSIESLRKFHTKQL